MEHLYLFSLALVATLGVILGLSFANTFIRICQFLIAVIVFPFFVVAYYGKKLGARLR